jgi:hypothetical protein
MRRILFAALAILLAAMSFHPARADDPQAGYYYPKPKSTETYQARVATMPDADRSQRIAFITGVAKEIASRPYAAGYLVFAKGDEADKLIIVGMQDGSLSTVYRARALLASLTASARSTQFFQQNTIADYATFLDFLKLLGFKQVTITDGVAFAHQVKIE